MLIKFNFVVFLLRFLPRRNAIRKRKRYRERQREREKEKWRGNGAGAVEQDRVKWTGSSKGGRGERWAVGVCLSRTLTPRSFASLIFQPFLPPRSLERLINLLVRSSSFLPGIECHSQPTIKRKFARSRLVCTRTRKNFNLPALRYQMTRK